VRQLTGAEMFSAYEVALKLNALIAAHSGRESERCEDVTDDATTEEALREHIQYLNRVIVQNHEDRDILRARVAELEPAAANWALVEAMPRGMALFASSKSQAWGLMPVCPRWYICPDAPDPIVAADTPAAALRAALAKGEGE